MFEEFREQAEDSFLDEEEGLEEEGRSLPVDSEQLRSTYFSLNPKQRLIILALLLVVICLVSAFCLLVTGRIVPPFP